MKETAQNRVRQTLDRRAAIMTVIVGVQLALLHLTVRGWQAVEPNRVLVCSVVSAFLLAASLVTYLRRPRV